jgi:NAD(P)-dependent dehydrogenase (short-subunit alcohol dehydrogenase family)
MLESLPPDSHACVIGASRGIGLEFVRQLATQPRIALVHAGCRDPARASALVALSREQPQVRPFTIDVADEASIARACAVVTEASPRLHLVVNAAGVLHDPALAMQPEKRLAEVRGDTLARAFAINAAGPLLLAKHLEACIPTRERAIFASISAKVGSIGDNRLGGWFAYRASKAAQNMALKTLAIEWARSRRQAVVVALHPGTTDTDLSRPFQANVPPDKLFTTERSARQLLGVIDRLQPADSGRFYAWDGSELPW